MSIGEWEIKETQRRNAELAQTLARFEREVIEAAKAWNSTNHRDTLKCEERLTRLGDAIDALTEFEAKQNQK